MNGHSLKVIRKTITAASKKGCIVLSYSKEFHVYKVEYKMSLQSLTFDQLSEIAFPPHV